MSKLDDLIKELCPNGVEWVTLLSVADVVYGFPCNASLFNTENKGLPLARIRDILSGISETFTEQDVPEKYNLQKGDLLVGMDGNFHVSNWQMDEGILCQRVCKFYSNDNEKTMLNKYLSHLLKPIIKKVEDSKPNGTVKHLLDKDVKAIKIPLPPLPVQEEIVRILDNFTELTSELTSELTARRKQYEYYRDSLFTFGDDVPIFTLSEVAQYSKDRINALELNQDNHIGVDNLLQDKQGKTISNYVPTEGRLTKYVNDDILIGNIRPYLKKIWFSDRIGGTNGDVLVIQTTTNELLPKYLYAFLCGDKFFEYNMQNSKGAKMPRGNKDAIMRYSIPVPTLTEQQHIVDILDRFDTLCNDISSGLPAEIKARQQQYEYYRDKLLTFEKLEVVE